MCIIFNQCDHRSVICCDVRTMAWLRLGNVTAIATDQKKCWEPYSFVFEHVPTMSSANRRPNSHIYGNWLIDNGCRHAKDQTIHLCCLLSDFRESMTSTKCSVEPHRADRIIFIFIFSCNSISPFMHGVPLHQISMHTQEASNQPPTYETYMSIGGLSILFSFSAFQ